jgi:hypothetical protein
VPTPWRQLPLDADWYPSAAEFSLNRGTAAAENLYVDETGGHAKLPELTRTTTVSDGTLPHLRAWPGGLLAVTAGGNTYSVDPGGRASKKGGTDHIILAGGGGRPSFAPTDEHVLIATGGEIGRYDGRTTSRLSTQAPIASHVGWVRGVALALEAGSGAIWYSMPGLYDQWSNLDTFTADEKPDTSIAMAVTDAGSIVVMGRESIEVFDISPDPTQPFYRTATLPGGLISPDAWCEAGDDLWAVTGSEANGRQVVTMTASGLKPVSEQIQAVLDSVRDWDGSWMGHIAARGQRLVVLQVPSIKTTFLYDRRKKKWTSAHGWQADHPILWAARSLANARFGCFAGGDGGAIYRVDDGSSTSLPAKMRWRSAPYPASSILKGAEFVEVDDLRLRVVRPGVGEDGGSIRLRARWTDNEADWLDWYEMPFGRQEEDAGGAWLHYGSLGSGEALQIEYETFARGPVRVPRLEVRAQAHG